MSATQLALRISAQHPRDFLDARVAIHHGDVRRRYSAARAFAHENVMVRARRDLREVRDGKDLMMRRDPAHRFADLKSDAPADTGVHLVEDQCRHAIEAGENRFEREHDAGELAP